MPQVTERELDLIIKELERLSNCYEKMSEKTMNKSLIIWLLTGAYGFSLFIVGLVLKLHFGG